MGMFGSSRPNAAQQRAQDAAADAHRKAQARNEKAQAKAAADRRTAQRAEAAKPVRVESKRGDR